MLYASVNLQTTGLDPNYCEIVEVAIVVDDLSLLGRELHIQRLEEKRRMKN